MDGSRVRAIVVSVADAVAQGRSHGGAYYDSLRSTIETSTREVEDHFDLVFTAHAAPGADAAGDLRQFTRQFRDTFLGRCGLRNFRTADPVLGAATYPGISHQTHCALIRFTRVPLGIAILLGLVGALAACGSEDYAPTGFSVAPDGGDKDSCRFVVERSTCGVTPSCRVEEYDCSPCDFDARPGAEYVVTKCQRQLGEIAPGCTPACPDGGAGL